MDCIRTCGKNIEWHEVLCNMLDEDARRFYINEPQEGRLHEGHSCIHCKDFPSPHHDTLHFQEHCSIVLLVA